MSVNGGIGIFRQCDKMTTSLGGRESIKSETGGVTPLQ